MLSCTPVAGERVPVCSELNFSFSYMATVMCMNNSLLMKIKKEASSPRPQRNLCKETVCTDGPWTPPGDTCLVAGVLAAPEDRVGRLTKCALGPLDLRTSCLSTARLCTWVSSHPGHTLTGVQGVCGFSDQPTLHQWRGQKPCVCEAAYLWAVLSVS